MKPAIFRVAAFVAVLAGSVCLAADEPAKSASSDKSSAAQGAAASEKSAKSEKGQAQARTARLTKPWKDLASLTDEQKKQIAEIHRKSVQDQKVIEEREKADIMALLNDQQKSELKAMQDKETAERKAKAGNKPAAKGAGDKTTKDGAGEGGSAAKQPI